ncbi:hypothetical protein G7046_g2184 [Stylonectria norvegica]|nr:hypothetical protein G7046_g2184 [Stylonectria norvegica]
MKASHAGLAIVSSLAVVMADALPPEDIPLQCVTICGPIVELTSICNVSWKRLKRRDLEDPMSRDWVSQSSAGSQSMEQTQDNQERLEEARIYDQRKRSFSIIVAAPTSFSFEVPETTALDLPSTSKTSILLTSDPPSIKPPSSTTLPDADTLTMTSTLDDSRGILVSLATSTSTSIKLSSDTSQQTGQGSYEGAEQQCVCLNNSFNVSKVAALCSSCISLAGNVESNMNIIMSVCKFTAMTYTPDQDTVADNIHVKATRPTVTANAVSHGAYEEGSVILTKPWDMVTQQRVPRYTAILRGPSGCAVR